MANAVEFTNDTSQMTYYKSCENCMSLEYRGIGGHVLYSSSECKLRPARPYPGVFLPRSQVWCVSGREGQHQDIDNLNEAQTKHDQLADCLGITDEKKFVYDGATGSFGVKLWPSSCKDRFFLRTHSSRPHTTKGGHV